MRLRIPLLGLTVLALLSGAAAIWHGVPRWTVENSPFLEPAVRALAGQAEFEQAESVDYECYVIPKFEVEPSWPMTATLYEDPLALESLLRSEDPRVRRTAAALLGDLRLGDPLRSLVSICVESDDPILQSKNSVVQRAAVRAFEANAPLARTEGQIESDPEAALELCAALASLNGDEARALLGALCEDPDAGIRDAARVARVARAQGN